MVTRQSGIIPKYDQSHWFRDAAALRAPGTASRRGGFKVDTTSVYFCPRYSYGFEIPDEVLDNQDDPFNLERDATEFVTDRIALRKEIQVSTSWFTTGDLGRRRGRHHELPEVVRLSASNPLQDMENYMDLVEGRVAREPNCYVHG